MNRRFVGGILIALALVNGCATQKSVTDPNELAATIARTGQGDGPPEPEKPKHLPNKTVPGECLKWAAIGGAACLVIAVVVILSMAKNPTNDQSP